MAKPLIAALFVSALLAAAPVPAASNPWLGTWSLRDAGQKPETLIYSDAGGGAMRMVSVEDRSELVTHFDGKPALNTGAGAFDRHALAVRSASPTSYTWTLFKEGKPWVRGRNVLAADHKSFTEVSWLAAKPTRKLTFVFDKR